MVRENFNSKTSSFDAAAHIRSLELQAVTGGSVDTETNDLEAILQKLRLNTITPEEAIAQADQIIGSRQDYH